MHPSCLNHVFEISKALYDLKQALKAWYQRLSIFLLNNNFQRGKIATTLFIRKSDLSILIVQTFMDDIIFGSPNTILCNNFSNLMKKNLKCVSWRTHLLF